MALVFVLFLACCRTGTISGDLLLGVHSFFGISCHFIWINNIIFVLKPVWTGDPLHHRKEVSGFKFFSINQGGAKSLNKD